MHWTGRFGICEINSQFCEVSAVLYCLHNMIIANLLKCIKFDLEEEMNGAGEEDGNLLLSV